MAKSTPGISWETFIPPVFSWIKRPHALLGHSLSSSILATVITTPIEPRVLAALRQAAGLTQAEAGLLVHASMRTWQQWEGSQRRMPRAATELWCLAAYRQGLLPRVLIEPYVRRMLL